MTTAFQRWSAKLPGYGLWLNQDVSQPIVTNGSLTGLPSLTPKPDYVVVKYGGDWGGLWGGPPEWGALSPKSQNPPAIPIIPMVYVVPDHVDAYPSIVGGLLLDGYPAVILDVEMEWAGHESELDRLLASLNPDANLIGISGFAWFDGWPGRGAAFGSAVNGHDVVYCPMAYLGVGWSPAGGVDAFGYIASELSRVVPNRPKSWIFDAAAVDAGMVQQVLPTLGPSFWEASAITESRWRLLQVPRYLDVGPGGGGLVGGDQAALNDLIPALTGDIQDILNCAHNAQVHYQQILKIIGGG